MHKEDDKLSLNMNEDFTLPNLEEGLNIDEIPSIEDLISIDKQEVEKIQETNSTSEIETPSNSVKQEETDNIDQSFDNNLETMNLFDEDIALTLDDTPLEDNNIDFNIEREEMAPDTENQEQQETADFESMNFDDNDDLFNEEENFSEENLSDTEEFPSIAETMQEDVISDISNDETTEFENSQADFEQTPEIVEEIETPSDETIADDTIIEDVTLNLEEEIADISEAPEASANNEDEIYKEETKHYTKSDDVFAKIDSLLNDDSAFVSGTTSELSTSSLTEMSDVEIPKPQFKPTFNPEKYLGKSQKSENTDEKLGILYTAKKVIDNLKNINDEENSEGKQSLSAILATPNGKKAIITAAVCAVVIGAGITGVSVFNNKSVEELDTLNKNDMTTPLETPQNEIPASDTLTQPIIDANANVSPNVPDINRIEQPKIEVKQDAIKSELNKQTKPATSESYLSVKKIQWQIPDYLSYSPNIKSYLQTAGKSIKLGLSSDLLLATEYAYSNVVKINLKMSNTGAVQTANVITSSGSKQIDDIVLQSVKSTLNVVKPPVGEVKTPDFNLTITINL